MPNRTQSKILDAGYALILEQGFNSTGISEILKKADVPKGSFYHYFASKEAFGIALIEHSADQFTEELKQALADKTHSPMQTIYRLFHSRVEAMAADDFQVGCLFGNLAQELAGQNNAISQSLEGVFTRWKALLAECFSEAQAQGELPSQYPVTELVEFFVMAKEGAMMRAKCTRSRAPFDAFERIFFHQLLALDGERLPSPAL